MSNPTLINFQVLHDIFEKSSRHDYSAHTALRELKVCMMKQISQGGSLPDENNVWKTSAMIAKKQERQAKCGCEAGYA